MALHVPKMVYVHRKKNCATESWKMVFMTIKLAWKRLLIRNSITRVVAMTAEMTWASSSLRRWRGVLFAVWKYALRPRRVGRVGRMVVMETRRMVTKMVARERIARVKMAMRMFCTGSAHYSVCLTCWQELFVWGLFVWGLFVWGLFVCFLGFVCLGFVCLFGVCLFVCLFGVCLFVCFGFVCLFGVCLFVCFGFVCLFVVLDNDSPTFPPLFFHLKGRAVR